MKEIKDDLKELKKLIERNHKELTDKINDTYTEVHGIKIEINHLGNDINKLQNVA
ncbi:MAG: hypothetical protein OXE77_07755 [Flavobacteriaceae bacterium]|nr:hypothetical protein [Flavobacteriaceae bacterium]MCY4266453.1 hypothetical protein [Flavobacteriaceae bacterium]MCY4298209.1 hypothetical protein [Flavobacteriaceae bacterium]